MKLTTILTIKTNHHQDKFSFLKCKHRIMCVRMTQKVRQVESIFDAIKLMVWFVNLMTDF